MPLAGAPLPSPMQPKAHSQRSFGEDDESLVRRIQERDERALEALYDRYSTAVYSLALRILSDRAAAEDVLGDVFWRVWRAAETHDPDRGCVVAWIMTIARRRAIDELRMRVRRERREGPRQAAQPVRTSGGPAAVSSSPRWRCCAWRTRR